MIHSEKKAELLAHINDIISKCNDLELVVIAKIITAYLQK